MEWEGANPQVQILSEDKTPDYYSYSFYEKSEKKNMNYIAGFKKLIYKNLYLNLKKNEMFICEFVI